jgi:hypothetical protein
MRKSRLQNYAVLHDANVVPPGSLLRSVYEESYASLGYFAFSTGAHTFDMI